MMIDKFEKNLSGLKDRTVRVGADQQGYNGGSALVEFSDGARLRTDFWRAVKDGTACISSFDHNQQYGLPAPIDAVERLRNELLNKRVLSALMDRETGDLVFEFTGIVKLCVFNFTSYEAWEVSFSDGSGELSNYVFDSVKT